MPRMLDRGRPPGPPGPAAWPPGSCARSAEKASSTSPVHSSTGRGGMRGWLIGSAYERAAVDADRLPGHVGGLVGDEVGDRGRDVLAGSHPADRDVLRHVLR